MSLLDSLNDVQYPEMVKRRAYDPSQYSTIKGSGLYAALNAANQGQNDQAAATGARMVNQYGAVMAPQSANQEYAMQQQLGALQPMDEAQRLRQWQQENQNAATQDAMAREKYLFDQGVHDQNMQFYGNLLGTAAGAAAGYGANKMSQNKQKKISERRNSTWGASDYNPYYTGGSATPWLNGVSQG